MDYTIENPKTLGLEKLNEEFDDTEDMGRRVITHGDHKFYLRSDYRSGHWMFSAQHGPVPKELEGKFTSIRACEHALAMYAGRKEREGHMVKAYHQDLLDKGFVPAPPKEEVEVKKTKKKASE